MHTLTLTFIVFSICILSTPSDRRPEPPPITTAMLDALDAYPGGLGPLPDLQTPIDNPQTAAKIELGKRLFFDTRLSLDRRTSCATCHNPEKAYTDGLSRSRGFQGVMLRRNSPTLLNAAFNYSQFWDGRTTSLDEQCKAPLLSPLEMNMVDERHLVDRLIRVAGYRRDFQVVFGATPSLTNIAKAIAAFERTLITPGSPFDRYAQGDKTALTDAQKRGLVIFFGKGSCSECHKGPNFTDNQFHNLGAIPGSGAPKDLGRYEVTSDPKDRGAFKTPSLRNAQLTAPYMHDGSFATLEEVIDFYDRGGDGAPNKSTLIYKLGLSPQDKSDLLAFLAALTAPLPSIQIPRPYPDDHQPIATPKKRRGARP